MLNTHFPRVIGDIGSPKTFDFPVIDKRILSAQVSAIDFSEGVSQSVRQDIFSAISELIFGIGMLSSTTSLH